MIKKRIEKLEKERPVAPAVPEPSRTLPRELTAEEFEALYAETMGRRKAASRIPLQRFDVRKAEPPDQA